MIIEHKNKENGNKEKVDGISLRKTEKGAGSCKSVRKVVHFIRRSGKNIKSPEQQRITNVLLGNIENNGLLDVKKMISEHEKAFGKSVVSLVSGSESNVYLFKVQ